jgi:hypothetical protein
MYDKLRMKIMVFWDVVLRILVDGHQWFGQTCCLCLHYSPQDGGTSFPQNTDTYLPNCVAHHIPKNHSIMTHSHKELRSQIKNHWRPCYDTNIHKNIKQTN